MITTTKKREMADYYLKGFSLTETAKEFGINSATVHNILKKLGIPRRTVSEGNSLKWLNSDFRDNQVDKRVGVSSGAKGKSWKLKHRKYSPKMIGAGNPQWKGGVTKLSSLIRSLPEYILWREKIFKRDNWTCQICSDRTCVGNKVILHADHIYPLHKLIEENQIKSVLEAILCEHLWEIDNGRCLCIDCHKKTDTFGKNAKKLSI